MDTHQKFMRKHPGWLYWVRRPWVALGITLGLATYALLMLPEPEMARPAWDYSRIWVFITALLAFSGIILADRDKPEAVKMAVSLVLIAVLAWLFYRYS